MVQTTIPIGRGTTEATSDEPLPRYVARTVISWVADRGHKVPTLDELRHRETPDGTGINAELMVAGDPAGDLIRSGELPITYAGETPDGAGTDSGAAHFTTHFVRENMTLRDALDHIGDAGQFETLVEMFGRTDTNADPVWAATYALITYARGWIAEAVITATDRFSKGSQSNDEAGQDVFDRERGEYRQVKCVTAREDAPDGTLFYQWDCRGQLVVGDDYKEVAAAVGGRVGDCRRAEKDVNTTLTYRTHSNYKIDGRTYRYLWW